MNQWLMPRYGTLEYRRMGLFMLILGLVALCLLMPDLALAQGFDGNFAPDKDVVGNVDTSVSAWWKVAAKYGLWGSVFAFLFTIFVLKGAGWWIPVLVALVCLFGEMFVNGAHNMMG